MDHISMEEKDIQELCKNRGLPYKADFLSQLTDDELNAGYIKFNIPDIDRLDSLNGEGVWGWVTPEEKEKYNDDSYCGEITAILCNMPLNFFGILFLGSEVVLQCHGENRPTISASWLQNNILSKDWFKEGKTDGKNR